MMVACRKLLAVLAVPALVLSACGDDDTASAGDGRPTVVVTTSTLGDIVEQIAGAEVDVVTVMPPGVDPHDFQASARQVNDMREADALIVNGAGFEQGLVDVIDAARTDGVPMHEAISAVDTIEFGAGRQEVDEHPEDEHSDEGHSGEGRTDPHFFLDPVRTAAAVEGIGEFLADIPGVDAAVLDERVSDYVADLQALHREVEDVLAVVDEDDRVLVTNHDAFGYFADRYGFEVVGTVIPAGSTTDGTSARDLAALAAVVRQEAVPAIFSDTSASNELVRALADEIGDDVEVVELFTESLGDAGSDAGSYGDMIRTNARRIAGALGT